LLAKPKQIKGLRSRQ